MRFTERKQRIGLFIRTRTYFFDYIYSGNCVVIYLHRLSFISYVINKIEYTVIFITRFLTMILFGINQEIITR